MERIGFMGLCSDSAEGDALGSRNRKRLRGTFGGFGRVLLRAVQLAREWAFTFEARSFGVPQDDIERGCATECFTRN